MSYQRQEQSKRTGTLIVVPMKRVLLSAVKLQRPEGVGTGKGSVHAPWLVTKSHCFPDQPGWQRHHAESVLPGTRTHAALLRHTSASHCVLPAGSVGLASDT